MLKSILLDRAAAMGIPMTGAQAGQFDIYHNMLVEANARMNLTRVPDDPAEAVDRNYLDCVAPLAGGFPRAATAVDVGSGAGFPGIPLAIMLPDTRFTLIDALAKRVDFLRDVIDRLGLNAEALHLRAEDAARRGDLRLERFVAGMADDPSGRAASARRAIVRRGDRIWSGYVIAGDQVFVNRLLWNLRPPRRDETVVFATSAPALVLGDDAAAAASDGPGGQALAFPFLGLPLRLAYRPIPLLPPAQHYIKRLVGMPGERVSIDPPRLLVDGAPAGGAPGIARVEGMGPSATGPEYAGYRNIDDEGMPQPHAPGFLQETGDEIALGDEYLPMGDNTRSSFDGRYWGPVPRPQMLGPAACVYWPLSVRWGLSAVR